MTLKAKIKRAFGYGDNPQKKIMDFLLKKELAGCKDDSTRWFRLFEKCEYWRKKYLLWEERTYIDGISGWNLSIAAYRLRLPEKRCKDWTKYLYHMTLLAVISWKDTESRTRAVECGNEYNSFSIGLWAHDYFEESGYASLTREQWLEEITGFLKKSCTRYQGYHGNSPEYIETMKVNYPKYKAVLEYLEQNTPNREVVRMNKHGGDETVWYFMKAKDCFYIVSISYAM